MISSTNPVLGSGQPRYQAVAQVLIDEIAKGMYPLGTLMPTEFELCDRFEVSRHTVREAIRKLAELGLVTRQAGVGTRVRSHRTASRYVHTSKGSADLLQYARDVMLVLTDRSVVIADDELSEFLECKPGQAWLRVIGERRIDGEERPIAVTQIYIAWPYRAVLKDIVAPKVPIYSLIEQEFGFIASEVNQQVSAVLLDTDAAKVLGVEEKEAGLKVIRKYRTASQELFEVAVNIHPGDRFSQSMTLKLESGTLTSTSSELDGGISPSTTLPA